jgi:hypothetical protein
MSASERPILPDNVTPMPAVSAVSAVPAENYERPSTLDSAAEWLGRTQTQVQDLLRAAYEESRAGAVAAVRKIHTGARRLREEKPMPLLAVISGCAFAAGVTLAIWRSRR